MDPGTAFSAWTTFLLYRRNYRKAKSARFKGNTSRPPSPEPGVGTAGGRGHLTVRVGQLVEPLLDDHPDETISHELKVRARGRRVPDDGLQLLDLIGAPQHLEFLAQVVGRRRLGYRGTGRLVAFHRGSFVLGYRAHSPANKERGL